MVLLFVARLSAGPLGPMLSGTFASIDSGSVVDLSSEGAIDWVHWGLYTETSLDRKAGVALQISDFALLDSPTGFAYVYQLSDNVIGYSWNDGTPTAIVTNTTTGVWAYGTPQTGSGFEISAPADTASRTLKVYVGGYGADGTLEAFLTDASAPGYTNTSAFNNQSGPNGVYTISYAGASAEQQLMVRWTLSMASRPDGNVTLQAAAMTSSTANNPPFVALDSPVHDAQFAAGSNILLSATARDSDGTVTNVEFYDGDIKLGEDPDAAYSLAWTNVTAGFHVLTVRATDNQGVVTISSPVEVFVHGPGGSLAGCLTVPPALPNSVDLTAEGEADWTHWGLADDSLFNRKAGVPLQISNFTKIGTNAVQRYADNYTGYSWSDGTPTISASNTPSGVFTFGQTNGFEITVPADTTPRTLKVHVGAYGAQAIFQAWLSDFSSSAYTDTTLSNHFNNAYGVYTLTYAAASRGQSLTVRYRSLTLFDRRFGNVTLQAAGLVVNSPGNVPPTVAISKPANGAVLTAGDTVTVEADASDSDGSVRQVEFFVGATSLAVDQDWPYSVLLSGLPPGNYTISAVATDDLGARATNNVSIVIRSLAMPVTLQNLTRVGSDFVFSFASQSGHTYKSQYTDALGGSNWEVSATVAGTGSTLTVTNKNATGAQRFYRVETK